MHSIKTGFKIASLAALALLLTPTDATGQWANSRGGPERDGARTGAAELPLPQVKWRHKLGGSLGGARLWSLPDPVVPRIALATGGRVRLKRWDDSLSWQGDLFGLTRFLADADVDNDGSIDVLFAAGGQPEATILGYTPDGEVTFRLPPGILGEVTTGARVVDLDGDGFRDLYVTSTRRGPGGVIAAAFRFPEGRLDAAEIMYTIDPAERDYFGGYNDVVAELDGTPGLEILALGHESVYVYDAATGNLETQTQLSGYVPFARAKIRLVDLNNDGVQEAFVISNEAWSEANNRRHITLLAQQAGRLAEVWTRTLGSDPDARIDFADSSISNLDGEGGLEIAFGVRNGDEWTTEIRDAATGVLLDSIRGERFSDVVASVNGSLLLTHDDEQPLRSYTFVRGSGATQVGTHPDLEIKRCRLSRPTVTETHRTLPCRIPVNGVPRRGLVAGEYNPLTGATTALVALDIDNNLEQTARFDGRGGQISSMIEIEPGHRAVIAVAHSDGVLMPLDERLRFLAPSPKPPFSWAGVQYGSVFSGVDFAAFPLVAPGEDAERIVALTGGGVATVIDASGEPTVIGGAEELWRAGSGNRVTVGDAGGTPAVVVTDARGAMTARDLETGDELWTMPDMFASDRILHTDPLVVPGSGGDQLWFHRRNTNTGVYDLTVLNMADGSEAYSEPNLSSNDGGWKRLALANWNGTPSPVSGDLNQLWRFNSDGQVAQIEPVTSSSVAIPVVRTGSTPLFLIDGLTRLAAFDPATQTTLWELPRVNSGAQRRGALLNVAGDSKYATSDPTSPVFRVIDVESGAVEHEFNLVGGEALDPATELPNPVPLLGNVTAITDLTGIGQPAYLVGSTDGFVYAINGLDGTMLWALFVGAQVGEIVPADWDGDQLLELVASTADGTLLGIDKFTGDGPAWVHDTDGSSLDDIDELQTEDTLYVAWAPVDGATAYEVAVYTNDNEMVTAGFADVGNRTEMTLTGLPLTPGVRYVVSVRAISSLGVSPDRPSDGVTVIPAGEEDGSGCCQVSGSPTRGAIETLLLAGLCLVLTRRRRRRPQSP